MDKKKKINDINTLLKFTVMIMDNSGLDLLEIGNELVNSGFDELSDSGFWIWELDSKKEFYSPSFRASLGYENEEDFPSTPESWQKTILPEYLKISMENFQEALETKDDSVYHQEVIYNKKNGGTVKLVCSGKLLWLNKEFKYIVGSHEIIQK